MGQKLKSFADWQSKLVAHINACAGREFRWGAFDCCLFVADAVQVMTGVDPAERLRGYTTAQGAVRAMLRECTGDVRDVVRKMCSEYNGRKVLPQYAQRGDVMIFKLGEPRDGMDFAAGICFGEVTYFVSEQGLAQIPTLNCEEGWRVCRP